ncbi:D-3-phosphoglycerate dehydrogenase, chloroplastic [Hordeum vulgare]|nr:D-3-phosphoglycerate dehydrogenase, chloroplastic [Hordeum vulgare]
MAPAAPSMLRHLDPSRRPRESRSTAVLSPALDQAVFFLRSHTVTITAADGVNISSPMAVGKALEAQLSVPAHSLRVTAHHPEHFFVTFTQPAHQVNAVRRGSIRMDGACFNISPWHEHDLATFDSLLIHVRVVIEKVPMHFWSVEGAEEILGRRVRVDRLDSRTLERGHTKTFACWVWARDAADIPTSHTLGVLPRGAGRVEEMEGFSPPDRRVAPPPASAEYSMLIHVDRVEDWTQPSPRSSRSAHSGLPSSGSDAEGTPFPLVAPASWTLGVEDGQGGERAHRRAPAPVASVGCRGAPRDSRPRDRDSEGGSGAGGHRSWKDVLLRRGASRAPRASPSRRRRSRSPPARRGTRVSSDRRSGAGRNKAPARRPTRRPSVSSTPTQPAKSAGDAAAGSQPELGHSSSSVGKDPVEEFFKTAKKPSLAFVVVDGLAADVHNAAEAAVAAPLDFVDATLLQAPGESVELDAFSPTLSAAAFELGQFHKATPSAANTLEVQLGAVTGRVRELEIGGRVAGPESRGLFRNSKQQPLIATVPARRPVAPPKTRATSTPTRSSARQAAIGSSVPVAQRASLRIVKELGLLGPRDRLTAEVAKALLQRFEEPLSDGDISVIARLTHLDDEALRVMAHMNGPDGAAEEAIV